MEGKIIEGDALELISAFDRPIDLVATDPPYAFGGTGDEHELSATVAVVLRESAMRLKTGGWMVVFCASSWRSTQYMVDAVRGVVQPVRIGKWCKPKARTKVSTVGWQWASVNVIAFRKGKATPINRSDALDYIVADPVMNRRRAELPPEVAAWAVEPFSVGGGLMLDPFAGSGALCRAAENARFAMEAVGFERRP